MNLITLAANAHSAVLTAGSGNIIDDTKLNFNATSLLALDIVLALIMFGIALPTNTAWSARYQYHW